MKLFKAIQQGNAPSSLHHFAPSQFKFSSSPTLSMVRFNNASEAASVDPKKSALESKLKFSFLENARTKITPQKTILSLTPKEMKEYFFKAIEHDDEVLVFQILEQKLLTQADFGAKELNPISLCIEHSAFNIFNLLVHYYHWTPVMFEKDGLNNPLQLAVDLNHADFVQVILTVLSDEEIKKYCPPLLSEVVANEHYSIASYFLARGVDPNQLDQSQPPALLLALINKDVPMIELLLQFNAQVEAVLNYDLAFASPLNQLLLQCIAEDVLPSFILFADKKLFTGHSLIEGSTVLQHALKLNAEKIIQYLFLEKIAINVLPEGTTPPLQLAVEKGQLVWVTQLVKLGAEVNYKNQLGKTALLLATEAGYSDIISFLCQHGAEVGLADHFGDTPLHKAVMHNDFTSVKILLEAGADLDQKNKQALSSYQLAKEHDLKAMLSLFSLYLLDKMGW